MVGLFHVSSHMTNVEIRVADLANFRLKFDPQFRSQPS